MPLLSHCTVLFICLLFAYTELASYLLLSAELPADLLLWLTDWLFTRLDWLRMVHSTHFHVCATLLLNLIKTALMKHFAAMVIYVPHIESCLVPAPFGSLQSNLEVERGRILMFWLCNMGVTSISTPMTVCFLKFSVAVILFAWSNDLYLVIVKVIYVVSVIQVQRSIIYVTEHWNSNSSCALT